MVFSDRVGSARIAGALSIAALMGMIIRRYDRCDTWYLGN